MAQVPDVLGQVIVCALSTADAEEGGKKVHKAPCADVGPCKTWLTAADAYPRNPVSATAMATASPSFVVLFASFTLWEQGRRELPWPDGSA